MIKTIYKLKSKVGELWWYSVIIFCSQRLSDLINMVLGLWIVPHYVPQEELGAVLPLVRIGSALCVPISILSIPFKKYLNTYAVRDEPGKVKSLLRDMFIFAPICACCILFYSRLVIPAVCERLRVNDTGLGTLIVIYGVLTAIAPVFSTALQALKKFRVVTIIGLFSAPLRFASMLVFLPAKGLTGYFIGHIIPLIFGIGATLMKLRKHIGKQFKSIPYFKTDGKMMLKYTVPVAVLTISGILATTTESFVIRHRLTDFESAGFYIISRFSDIAIYLGNSIALVLFPLAAGKHEQGHKTLKMLVQSLGMAAACGILLTTLYMFFGKHLLGLNSMWHDYAGFSPLMTQWTGVQTLRALLTCYISYELACRRFSFVYCYSTILILESILLYSVTGFTFFTPYVPAHWISWVDSLAPCRLAFVIGVVGCFFCVNTILMSGMLLKSIKRRKP